MTAADPGAAFADGWRAQVSAQLAAHGFATAGALAAARPGVPLTELAREIGGVAAVQLSRLLVEDALAAGQVARCAADLLVRQLRRAIPAGWPASADRVPVPVARALALWKASLGEAIAVDLAPATAELATDSVPRGWLPETADDPRIARFVAHALGA